MNTEPDLQEGNVRLLRHMEKLWSGPQQVTKTVKYTEFDDVAVRQEAFLGTGTPTNQQTDTFWKRKVPAN